MAHNPKCPICGGSGTVPVQKIVNGKTTIVSEPCWR